MTIQSIPRKTHSIPAKEQTECFRAPIPLFPEPGTVEDETGNEDRIKLKLRRVPQQNNSPQL